MSQVKRDTTRVVIEQFVLHIGFRLSSGDLMSAQPVQHMRPTRRHFSMAGYERADEPARVRSCRNLSTVENFRTPINTFKKT